jgi:hypothetical protein
VRICWFTATVLSILAVGCSRHAEPAPTATSLNANVVPEQFGFITGQTTLQQVVDRLGKYDHVRGSGISYYEYDLPDGSAVIVGPEWPFDLRSRIRNVTFYHKASEITLSP